MGAFDPMIPAGAMSRLQKFDKAAEQCINSFLKTLEAPWPPIIYHYTNDVGLRGILESGKLWLTDMFNLNDPSELRHGLSHVARILMAKAVENGSDDGKALAQKFEGFLTEGAYQKIAHHFVLSFSAVGDDLGQWRAYADNGRGYALGFDAQEIMRAFKSPTGVAIPNNATFPITYDDGKCIKIHEEVIELMFGLIAREKMEAGSKREYFNHLFALLAMHAFRVALAFKHEAYNNEQEIRFVEMYPKELPPMEIKIRSRPYSLVKYRECDWQTVAPKALKRVVIGPSAVAERGRAHQFLMDCFITKMSCRSDQQFLTEQCDGPLRPDVSLLRASVGRYRSTAGGYLGVFGDETPVGPRRGPGRGPVAVAGIVVDSVEVVQKRNALVGRPAVPYDLSARVHCIVGRLAL